VTRVPWADAISQAWSRGLGDVPQRAFVVDTLASSLQPGTSQSYGRKWDAFQSWCEAQADAPSALPATTVTVLRYLADVGMRATVAASSLQPYLTAINAVHRDLLLEPPALGPAIVQFRRGLAHRQLSTGREAERAPLPAAVVGRVLAWALAFDCTARDARSASLFRAGVAVVLNFIWFARADTGTALCCKDIDTASGITLVDAREKGKSLHKLSRLISMPADALPSVHRLLLKWEAYRGPAAPDASYYALPQDGARRITATALDEWLQLILSHLGARAPLGQKWTGHSLRKGAASSANAINVTLAKICFLGGWSIVSSVVHTYIDPTVRADDAAWLLFGWLVPAAPRYF
jgi:hypothetical protein